MNALLQLFRDLVLFRRGPQDLPHSPALLGGLILADLAVSLALMQAVYGGSVHLFSVSLLSISLLLGLPYVALHLAKRTARFNQAASALVGTDLVFTLLAAPILVAIMPLPAPGTDPTPLQITLSFVALAMTGWQLGVRGHVFRHTLDVSFPQGVLVALIFFLIERVLLAGLYPGPAQ
jgi:hypothetical protein